MRADKRIAKERGGVKLDLIIKDFDTLNIPRTQSHAIRSKISRDLLIIISYSKM